MYKKQLTFQRILCFAVLIVCAAVFVYSLGIMTDLYDSLYNTIRNPEKLEKTTVTGSRIYYDMQGFNRNFLHYSIALLLLAVLLFITGTHRRRKYYIGNFVSVGIFSAAAIAFSVWAHTEIEAFKAQFLQINFEELAAHAAKKKSLYTESTFWFDIHYLIFGLLLLLTLLLILNLFWKKNLEREEQALIGTGKEV